VLRGNFKTLTLEGPAPRPDLAEALREAAKRAGETSVRAVVDERRSRMRRKRRSTEARAAAPRTARPCGRSTASGAREVRARPKKFAKQF
jgi:hypothetical protein